jgi:hypothetical protein
MGSIRSWQARFIEELRQAETAREAGNEGMARVCARRAAGIAAGEYLRRHGLSLADPSAYVRLKFLLQLPHTPPEVQEVVSHFIMRINPDRNLPIPADLIAEARWLADELLTRSN